MNYKQIIPLTLTLIFILAGCQQNKEKKEKKIATQEAGQMQEKKNVPIDTLAYQKKLITLSNGDTTGLWPNHLRSYPLDGAILPFKRIVAYYGNLYSKRMGILGEYPPKELWRRLNVEVKAWEKADSTTP